MIHSSQVKFHQPPPGWTVLSRHCHFKKGLLNHLQSATHLYWPKLLHLISHYYILLSIQYGSLVQSFWPPSHPFSSLTSFFSLRSSLETELSHKTVETWQLQSKPRKTFNKTAFSQFQQGSRGPVDPGMKNDLLCVGLRFCSCCASKSHSCYFPPQMFGLGILQ